MIKYTYTENVVVILWYKINNILFYTYTVTTGLLFVNINIKDEL